MSDVRDDRTQEPKEKSAPEAERRERPVRLDLDKLDLTVREIEDRIRPGETNVFDK